MSKPMPQLLKGFRDFLPKEKRARDFVMGKIITAFENFGFEPIETPTLEYKETIMGKYGEEADKLVYSFTDRGEREVAMRYDQTVPTARVIANYQNDLPFPFRRYQTQNVFRADKPQRGRYREFTQCDIDIFGSTDPLSDAEILACTYAAYKNIGFNNVTLRINDRQTLLSTLSPFATGSVNVLSIIQSIDKLDKMSKTEVRTELERKGLSKEVAQSCLVTIAKANASVNLQQIMENALKLGVDKESIAFTPTIARGLDYYTGMIFEVGIPGYEVGSVGGGGRYDNLINNLCGVNIPAVGMAFGFDRTVEAALQLGLINATQAGTKVLVTIFAKDYLDLSLAAVRKLRAKNIATEVYPKFDRMDKQLKYANKKGISYVILIGDEEVRQNKVTLKNMQSGEQQLISLEEISL